MPVFCNVLHATAGAARSAPAADIVLMQCDFCSAVFNAVFAPDLAAYAPGYENSLHHSATFRQFSDELVERLVRERPLSGGTVVEVGSGGGSFLRDLCERANAHGVGFDPSRAADETDGAVEIRAEAFPTTGHLPADLIVARHVFEHLDEPSRVASAIATALRSHPGVFYVEVPDGTYLLESTALWDVIYEHPTHFTAPALVHLLERAGMNVTRHDTAFGGQYLWAEAVGSDGTALGGDVPPAGVEALCALGQRFASDVERRLAYWEGQLAGWAGSERVAVWGAGSKGVSLLNMLPSASSIELVVDLNPLKHGRFVPVTGHVVVGPEQLVAARPTVVLVMNPIYRIEVEEMLRALGLSAKVIVPA